VVQAEAEKVVTVTGTAPQPEVANEVAPDLEFSMLDSLVLDTTADASVMRGPTKLSFENHAGEKSGNGLDQKSEEGNSAADDDTADWSKLLGLDNSHELELVDISMSLSAPQHSLSLESLYAQRQLLLTEIDNVQGRNNTSEADYVNMTEVAPDESLYAPSALHSSLPTIPSMETGYTRAQQQNQMLVALRASLTQVTERIEHMEDAAARSS
jgi:hypothetical protein